MNLVIQKSGKYEYVSFRESFWDPVKRKYSSRTVKNFGRLDILQKDNPNILEDLQKELDKEKNRATIQKEAIIKKRARQIISRKDTDGGYADNKRMNLGCCVYRQIWNKLRLSRKLKDIQKKREHTFDFAEAVFYMTASRLINPDSKLSQWKKRRQFLSASQHLSLNHLYRSIDLLIEHKDQVIGYLNHQMKRQYKRAVSAALYDVTTYYFESQKPDNLRRYGFSKDNKINEVQVVMGLLIDEEGIPIDYELFPGNTSEFSTMIPILKKLKEHYGIHQIVITADRGLNSGSNLMEIKRLGMEYVMGYRLGSAPQSILNLLEEPSGWVSFDKDGTNGYKITTETRTLKGKGKSSESLTSGLLLGYSANRANKDRKDRRRLIEKAQRFVDSPGLIKSELKKGGKQYLVVDSGKIKSELDEAKIRKSRQLDGYYGIVYSDRSMTADRVISIYHGLWKIEESFRISKSLLEARPCFHWSERRIRGHFLICYLSLVLQRLLELELRRQDIVISTEGIIESLREAILLEVKMGSDAMYYKSGTEGHFEAIAKTVGLDLLPHVATASEVRKALKIKNL